MRKQITNREDLKGKVIEDLIDDEENETYVLLEGNEFFVIGAESSWNDGSGDSITGLESETPELCYSWISMGICSEIEFKVLETFQRMYVQLRYRVSRRRLFEQLKKELEND